VLLDVSLYELLYAPYLSKIEGEGIIVMNPHGVYAAKAVGKKVVVDLMDLWSCHFDVFTLNAFDFHALRGADLVIAWSRAIAALLRSVGLRRVEYLPYGLDLESFDPLNGSPAYLPRALRHRSLYLQGGLQRRDVEDRWEGCVGS
jgi:hypothetical protein